MSRHDIQENSFIVTWRLKKNRFDFTRRRRNSFKSYFEKLDRETGSIGYVNVIMYHRYYANS